MQVNDVPAQELAQPSDYPQCAGLIDRVDYWTLPGSLGPAVAYAQAHPPDHLPSMGGSSGTDHGVFVQSLSFGNISHAGDLQVQIAFTALRQGVAARVDAQSVWNYPAGCEFGGHG